MKTTGWSMALPAAVLVGLLVGAVPRAEAAVRTTAAAGNWNDTATWVDGGTLGLPVAGDTVVVNHAVTLDATTPELAAFTNNATLTFDGWNSALRATTIALGGTVTHLVNSDESGTPGVYESWTPDNRVLIEGHDITVTGTINADHMGYKGTRNSAAPRGPGAVVGQHGAGHGGRGASQWGLSGGGGTYGSALAPIDPGSGSGVSNTGGNGGGAVRIVATGRVTVTGTITANGQRGSSSWGCRGSGGSVYITCETFAGTGTIRANGGEHNGEEHAGGGGGRVAVVYDTTAQASVSPKPTVTLSAGGGRGRYFTRSQMGDPGTVHVSDTSFFPKTTIDLNEGFVPVIDGFTAWSPDSLTINNAWVKFPDGFALTPTNTLTVSGDVGRLDVSSNAVIRCASLNVTGGGQLWLYSAATNGVAPDYGVKLDVADTITVANNSSIFPASHPINGGSPILIAKDVDVQSGGTISANSLGFGFNYGPGSYSMLDPAVRASGAGHGGHGGSSTYGVMAPGATYGSLEQPLLPGSGGARPSSGAGGGLIRIEAWGTVTVNGNLTANGGNFAASHGSGGSGGAIFIQCRAITGSATLSARGGNFCGQSGNSGGGGRIAVWFRQDTFTGSSPDVSAGAAAAGRSHDPQPGTVYWYEIPPAGTVIMLR